jgi:hypothetical protein
MTSKAAFKSMFKRIEFSAEAAKELVDTECVDSMLKLSRITPARASKLAKAIRSPGGASAGVHVTEAAEHNLVIVAAIALNTLRVSRTIECEYISSPDTSLFDRHETQRLMEEDWCNKTAEATIVPLNEKDLKKGWKILSAKFKANVGGIRGLNTRAPLTYLLRETLIPPREYDDNEIDHQDIDHELVARHPIIAADYLDLDLERLEAGGPRKKVANVNTDNAVLFGHLKKCFEGTSWWTHARGAERNKDGRVAYMLLDKNLQGTNAMDHADAKNKAAVLTLRFQGEQRNWGLVSYINAHKKHHHIQKDLHDDHGFNDFTDREKVLNFTNGIETNLYDYAILAINTDTLGARINFEKASLKMLDYKAIIDERHKARNVSSYTTGRGGGGGHNGGGGRGSGRGYGGRGNDQGGRQPGRGGPARGNFARGRGGRGRGGHNGHRAPNYDKHVTTKGGQALNVAKLPNGDWDTISIGKGDHDFLANKQDHISTVWLPNPQYMALEPLERRKLYLNQGRNKKDPPVHSVAAVSLEMQSTISTLTTVVSALQTSMDVLIERADLHTRKLASMKRRQKTSDLFDECSDSSEEDNENEAPRTMAHAIARGGLKVLKKKRQK